MCMNICRGQIDVMRHLADEAKLHPSMHVMFLTPCHATPYYSHVHSNITMDFLDCSPPGKNSAAYLLLMHKVCIRGYAKSAL